ncbi:MAG: MFS transporter [Kiritimatiellae bacterium]|nr:MFS transporter [Kiritimatiellia bacterium]
MTGEKHSADGSRKWTTLAFLCLAFFFYMTDRHLFGLLVIPIQKETGLSDIQIGFIDTVLFWVIALAMPFSGWIGDRFARKRVIAVSIVLWGLFTVAMGLVGGFIGMLLVRSILTPGVQTLYGPSANALIASEHRETRTVALATHQGAMYVGLLSSGAIVSALLAYFGGWRSVYFAFGAMTLLVGVAFAAVFWRDGSRSVGAKKSLAAGMRAFFGNPAALCAGAGFVVLMFVSNATAAWAPKFVALKFNLGVGEAAHGVMFGPNLAAMAAVIGAGYVTDIFVGRHPRFRLALQITALLVGTPMLVAFGFSPTVGGVWAALVGWGVVRGLLQSNNYASVFDVVPPESRASAVGFLSVIGSLVGSLSPLLLGILSQRYGLRGFEIGFASMGALLVLAALVMAYSYLFLFMKRRVEG